MASARRLLVVEDDPLLRRQLRWSLTGCRLLLAEDREGALALLRAHEPQVVLLDLGLPPAPNDVSEGFALLMAILALAPATKVIILTGQEGRAHAVRAIGAGAFDFCTKPLAPDVLGLLVERAFHLAGLEAEGRDAQASSTGELLPGVIGASPAMAQVCRVLRRIVPVDVGLVIQGESGTGKEVVARAVHALGPRAGQPFVAINCAAIPLSLLESELFGYEAGAFTGAHKQTPGRIERAHGGTLFLDEIGDLPLPIQVKLLRFLQERVVERVGGRREIRVDVRVVSATHQDLARLVADGRFREDLYYRLGEIAVTLPPLRARAGDAILLARHLLEVYRRELGRPLLGFADDALDAIDAHPWPGNVRELQNRIKRAILLAEGRRLRAVDLELGPSATAPEPINLRAVRERAEAGALRRALARAHGNISKAARLLGISRPTLYDLMRHHSLRE
jgi:two-component system, NtrC family, response regulator